MGRSVPYGDSRASISCMYAYIHAYLACWLWHCAVDDDWPVRFRRWAMAEEVYRQLYSLGGHLLGAATMGEV